MATGPHRVGIVVFDRVKMLDIAGPSEVFAESNRLGADYALSVCAVGGGAVRSSTGMRIAADLDAATDGLGFDTLLVAGGDLLPTRPIDPHVLADPAGAPAAYAAAALGLRRHRGRPRGGPLDRDDGRPGVGQPPAPDQAVPGRAGHDAAERAGYGSSESLRRAFVGRLGVSPRAYQQRFRSARRHDAVSR